MCNTMKRIMKNKGQLSLEAGIILLFMLTVLSTIWLGGPLQQSAEKSIDTNGIVLAARTLDTIASAVEVVGIGGAGERKDFVIHIPFNTVDIDYNDTPTPHLTMTVLLYNNASVGGFPQYRVDSVGNPSWYAQFTGPGDYGTSFYYQNITQELRFPIDDRHFPLCDIHARKDSVESRGPSTQFYFFNNDTPSLEPITFCCEAGFNLHMYIEKNFNNPNAADVQAVNMDSRHYYSLPGEWIRLG